MTNEIIDLHMHVIHGADDGASDLDESMEMIKIAYSQGIRTIVCTPHGSVFFRWISRRNVHKAYQLLVTQAKKLFPDLNLILGAEIRSDLDNIKQNIALLKRGKLPTIGNSSYVLIEFENFGLSFTDVRDILKKYSDNGFRPIIAHIERYFSIIPEFQQMEYLHNCGYYFQINLDSVINSGNEAWHKRVLELLNAKLVDFIGTDAHHSKRRSPEIAAKVNYLYAHYDKEYVNEILFENARRLLL